MIPIVVFAFITLIFFLYSMKWGVLTHMSSGLGLAAGLAVFFFIANRGEQILNQTLRLELKLEWQGLLIGAGILGIVAYFFSWVIAGFILRFLFNPDSFLHPLCHGIPGGLLSLIPSGVLLFALANICRMTGTVQELNYAAAVAQPDIVEKEIDKLPPLPTYTQWRDQIEKLGLLVKWLDLCDPLSRRENRNFGLVTLFTATQPAREFSEKSSQMASILSDHRVRDWINSEELAGLLKLKDNVSLVMCPDTFEIASRPDLKNRLRAIQLKVHVDEFVQYLENTRPPALPPSAQPASPAPSPVLPPSAQPASPAPAPE